ncbi:MAG: IS200/IS605 family transposase [Anaerolineales bacterium]
MRAAYSHIYIHLIWATWDRLELIDSKMEPILYSYLANKCEEQKGILLQIGGNTDHVHLLVKIHTASSIGQFVKNIKGSSSHYINQIIHPGSFFKWQGGYAAISVSPDQLSKISRYISRQKDHHKAGSSFADWEIPK